MKLQGHFVRKYYQHKRSQNVWSTDVVGRWAEYENWGPMKLSSIKQNKLKIGGVKMEFCVADCTEIAEYKSDSLKDNFSLMEKGFSTTLKLQDQCKCIQEVNLYIYS